MGSCFKKKEQQQETSDKSSQIKYEKLLKDKNSFDQPKLQSKYFSASEESPRAGGAGNPADQRNTGYVPPTIPETKKPAETGSKKRKDSDPGTLTGEFAKYTIAVSKTKSAIAEEEKRRAEEDNKRAEAVKSAEDLLEKLNSLEKAVTPRR